MNERILVVDDDHDAADALVRLINTFDCEARAVYDGSQAIEQAAEFLPDMALIDIGMPDLNGYETVARIRQQRGSEHVILVAVTGWTREEDKRRAYDCGFDLHVAKPMSAERLKELMELLDPGAGGFAIEHRHET
jgi:CheY-like chemotaxis protein